MLKVGLTGGIGSGKSTVSQIFRVLGIPVFDADSQAKLLMETDQQLVAAIQREFGTEVYTGGKLNRQLLAEQVFNNEHRLNVLNALVHPVTIAHAEQWSAQQTSPYTIKEAALFFEAGSAANLDYMIGVYAPRHVRIYRVIKRDGVTREQVISRMDRQINEELKMKLCDFVLTNDEQELLLTQVVQLHHQLLAKANTP